MPPKLTRHQNRFISSLALDVRQHKTRGYIEQLLGIRREEAAALRRLEARFASFAQAGEGGARMAGDARAVARAAMRAAAATGLSNGADAKAADIGEALLRDSAPHDLAFLRALSEHVTEPSRARIRARLLRLEEEIEALELLEDKEKPGHALNRLGKRVGTELARDRASGDARDPGPRVAEGSAGHGIYREVVATIVAALSASGSVSRAEAAAVAAQFAPHAPLSLIERREAAWDYLVFVQKRWKELGKEARFDTYGGEPTLVQGSPRPA